MLGNALRMMGDVQRFLVEQHLALGPVFRVRALNQAFTIMAGQEANRFLHEHGEEHFSSEETMGGLDREFDMRVHVLTGVPHRRLRRVLGGALTRDLVAARWDELGTVTESRIRSWHDTVRVVDQCQRLAADQLTAVLTGTAETARFDRLRSAFELVLEATVTGKWPRAVLRLPAYVRAREEIRAFAAAALERRAAQPHDGTPDLLDHILAATDEHGRPYPTEMRVGMALQGYFAGINTIAYLYSFLVHVLLRNPGVHAQVAEEAGSAFTGDTLPFERLRTMPLTQQLVLETLRRYPSAPGSTRTVVTPFEFGGFRLEKGTRVLVATTVPHHLPQHFPDPEVIDLGRDFAQARRDLVFAPFSVGAHTCLGSGITSILGAMTAAHLVHGTRLGLPSPGHRIRITASPGPNPGKRFRATVLAG